MFYPGQKVICIKGTRSVCGVELKEYAKYTVKSIWHCKCDIVLDVGLRISSSDSCFKCNTLLSTDGVWWLYAWRFAPLEEWQSAERNVKKLLEGLEEQIEKKLVGISSKLNYHDLFTFTII